MTTEKDKARVSDNELIAEFMGEEISAAVANHGLPIKVLVLPRKPISEFKTGRPIECKYTTSWDWLMPVVEKIESLGYYTNIFKDEDGQQTAILRPDPSYTRNAGSVIIGNIPVDGKTSKIEATYKAVVQFIKWHNDQR